MSARVCQCLTLGSYLPENLAGRENTLVIVSVCSETHIQLQNVTPKMVAGFEINSV